MSLPLTKTGVSDNAGGVKYISTTLLHALKEERAISLSLKMCRSKPIIYPLEKFVDYGLPTP